ncbi:MAG TPA: SPOR domain-containing protein [Bryobacteraceae bacterium]|nr:SPOR domain-containing protein [Bryobacteraceae bacterium]
MSQGDEKELILGNKQLVSLFFVVVALCGVFFALGYMVRGSSLKSSAATADNPTSAAAPTPDTVKRQQPEPPTAEPPTPAPAQMAEAAAPQTRPAQDVPATTAPAPAVPEASSVATPETGATYVQVGALARADAESTVRTLREQHFPALLAASSKEGLYRVLVGPYHQTTDVADAKARLKALGFADTIVQKQ